MLINNPPNILPNGTRINDIEHFYQSAKPTTRINGSALVIGDIWVAPTGIRAVWNGTYWLDTNIQYYGGTRTSGLAAPNATDATPYNYPQNKRIFARNVSYSLTLATSGNSSNHYLFRLVTRKITGGTDTIYTSTTQLLDSGRTNILDETVNRIVAASYSGVEVIGLGLILFSVGSPPTVSNFTASVAWSLVYE